MNLKPKVRRYKRLKAELQKLETEIKQSAAQHFERQGCLIRPRFERVLEQFGG